MTVYPLNARPRKAASRPALAVVGSRVSGWVKRVRPKATAVYARLRTSALQFGAFGAFTCAAWRWSMIAGLVVLGISLLSVEYLGRGGE